jgi:excisionase family DNA binding protein
MTEEKTREVLTADEAAEFLGFNPYTVREKARTGEIPGRKVGKEWRFSRSALLDLRGRRRRGWVRRDRGRRAWGAWDGTDPRRGGIRRQGRA